MQRARARLFALLLACASVAPCLGAATSAPAAAEQLVQVMHNPVNLPSSIRFAPDGRLFMLELWSGNIRVYPDTSAGSAAVTWANLPVMVDGERGLLGLAFHPQFADSPYVYFLHSHPDSVNRLVRLRDTGNAGVDLAVLFETSARSFHHNGGRIAFGPDGMLYLTYGDQDLQSNADNVNVLPGKIFRLTPMGEPAPGNPPLGGLPHIFAYGTRNAFGLCFDAVTGVGYFTENGPECWDEVNVLSAGGNYGWGTTWDCAAGQTSGIFPMVQYTPTIAPTGIWCYRGAAMPAFQGNLFFGSFNDGKLRRIVPDPQNPWVASHVEEFWDGNSEVILDVTEGPEGRLWVATTFNIVRFYPDKALVGVDDLGPAFRFEARPNPSSGVVTFSLPAEAGDGALEIVDLSGRLVRRVTTVAGVATWDGADALGRRAAPGVYLARARTGRGESVRRIVRLGR